MEGILTDKGILRTLRGVHSVHSYPAVVHKRFQQIEDFGLVELVLGGSTLCTANLQ